MNLTQEQKFKDDLAYFAFLGNIPHLCLMPDDMRVPVVALVLDWHLGCNSDKWACQPMVPLGHNPWYC